MWTVYILRCSDGSFYVGLTNDLKQRIRDHQSGDGAQYTCLRLPVRLEYSERFRSKKGAFIKDDIAKLQQLSQNKS